MPKTATTTYAAAEVDHYDRHSRTNPMANCNVTECKQATRHARTEDTHVFSKDSHGREILTVAQLREALDGVDGALHVVIDTGDWYDNVKELVIPADTDGREYNCVTIFGGTPLDTRQF